MTPQLTIKGRSHLTQNSMCKFSQSQVLRNNKHPTPKACGLIKVFCWNHKWGEKEERGREEQRKYMLTQQSHFTKNLLYATVTKLDYSFFIYGPQMK